MPRKPQYGDEEGAFSAPEQTDEEAGALLPAPASLTLERQVAPVFDPQEQLAQLLKLMQSYRDAGMIQQRGDGSFVLPGQQDARWDARLKVGSTCHCQACTIHNQRHWICMICHSSHEWVLVADRPRTMRTELGQGAWRAVCIWCVATSVPSNTAGA